MKKQSAKKKCPIYIIIAVVLLAVLGLCIKPLYEKLTYKTEEPYQGQVMFIANPAETYGWAPTQSGCYSLMNENLMYTDYSTKQQCYLCSDPACTHTSDSCTSWLGNAAGEVYLFAMPDGSTVYYAQQGTGDTEDNGSNYPAIFSMNPDGSERKVLTQLKENARITGGIAADEQYLYYNVVTVKGITAEPVIQLMRTDRDSGKTDVLVKNLPVSYQLKSASGTFLIYETTDEEKILWKAYDLQSQKFQDLYSYRYDDFEGKTAVYGNLLFLLARKGEDNGTLTVYDLKTGEMHTIENVPIFSGDTCTLSGFLDETWLIIDNADTRNPNKILQMRHLVNVKTGEIRENTVAMDWYGDRCPVMMIAERDDEILIQTGHHAANVLQMEEGVAVTQKIEVPTWSLIRKEDFYQNKANIVTIQDAWKTK